VHNLWKIGGSAVDVTITQTFFRPFRHAIGGGVHYEGAPSMVLSLARNRGVTKILLRSPAPQLQTTAGIL